MADMIYKAAVVQASPVMFDKDATIAKAVSLIADAAGMGARLVVFFIFSWGYSRFLFK